MRLHTLISVPLMAAFAGALAFGQAAVNSPLELASPPQLPAVVAASDAQAEAALAQALNAAGGSELLATLQDFTASGTIAYSWAGKAAQGTVTLRGRGLDQFRLDAVLLGGTRSWAVSHGLGTFEKPVGAQTPVPGPQRAR